MIGNCNSMLEWNVRENEIDGGKVYAVEVNFKDGESCPAEVTDAGDKKCFTVTKIGADGLPVFEKKPFSNDIQGFQKCLEVSGVVGADGRINEAAIYKQPVSQTFSGIDETGKLAFLSHGPVSSQIDPRFGLERVNGCDVYEKIHPTIGMVYSSTDLERNRLASEADTLRNCQPNEYQRLVDFIERNNYEGDLGAIRDSLILQAAEATAKKIAENKDLTEDDLKVIADFDRFIVEPKRQQVADQFNALSNLEGTELAAGRTRLQTLRNELLALGKAPYFQKVHVDKLLAKGMFADAEKMEGIRIAVAEGAKVGTTVSGVTVTPDAARIRIANARGELANKIVTARENYDIRTGVTTGMAQSYTDLANAMNRNIERRTQNYTQEIQSEYARVQPGGYCYRYFRNTQKCIQDSMQRIQELQNALRQYNQIDLERSQEFAAKASQYATLEAEGRQYVARQNGEEVPAATPADTTVVPPRTADAGGQVPGQPGGQQSMLPPWMMNQTQPYGNQTMMNMPQNPFANMYGQNQNMMGQAGFQAGFGYQGTMGQNFMGQQQPQYGQVGMNWFGMGQQQPMYGNQMMGGQQMFAQQFGQQQTMFGQQPMFGQNPMMNSPYGQMYAQSPYMQQPGMGMGMGMGMGQQPAWMSQGYNYPNLYGR